MKEKYLKGKEAKKPVQALMDKLKSEYQQVQDEVVTLMNRSANCLNRLQEIALKPNPLSAPEYIDMLIEGEKHEAKSGWKQRVQALIKMKEKAETMDKVDRGEELLQSPPTGFVKKSKTMDKTDTKTNKDQDNKDTDQGITETNTKQDQDMSGGQTDTDENRKSANDPNQDDDGYSKNKDQDTDTDTDTDKNEEITETDTSKDQDRAKTNEDTDQFDSESGTSSDQ
ncbi:hypothetical protein Q5P01_022926 [Channa striata]|uniref:Uncharacterized protein n=1 Tax=Channa striata TaxID=64152 RepID=A0AA88RWD4_CHASR|nr:hypothetical protein Q5P01_022926 [Channa striata]